MEFAMGPQDEALRLASLRRLRILDTPAEGPFDRVALIAREMFAAPMAGIALADATRQWFKARSGFSLAEAPRHANLCAQAILGDGAFEVCDAHSDGRFRDDPLVSGEAGVRYYLAAPIISSDGARIGVLCVMDNAPRKSATMERVAALNSLAILAAELIETRFSALESHEANLIEARAREKVEHEAAEIVREAAVKHQAVLDVAAEARSMLDEVIETSVARANEAAMQARALLQNAIEVAQIGLSPARPERTVFDPAHVVQGIVTVSAHAARRRSANLNLTYRLDGVVLKGDSARLRHALLHFVSGALSEALPGDISLMCAAHRCDNSQIELRVEAIYFPAAAPDQRLRLVSEADDDGASEQDFAICRRAVESMGGALWADKLPDGREARWISIPFASGTELAEPSATQKRVLIADDMPANRRVLSAIVEAQGWRAVTVSNGFEAIDACMRERFDLVVLDIMMPGMNGLETARCIRALGGWRSMAPLLAVSAETRPNLRNDCLAAGINECVAKPVQPAPLSKLMTRLMDCDEDGLPRPRPHLAAERA